jgi:putative spermidine/putrescine transport system substrate-binding protein|tara:strand:- start:761 stop:1840 length:1080 start_codon:yes stop_codon:yes gene_type:complete
MKHSIKFNRTLLSAAIISLGVSFTSVSQAGEFDGVTLKVATWGGSWKENIITKIAPKFEALGGTLEFVTGSPASNLAKLIAGRGKAPFDVMEVMDSQEQEFFVTNDFIQKIDYKNMSNVAHLQEGQYNDWRIASWHTQESICFNRDKFAELGIPTPTTYADLINPKLAGRVSIPDITSGGGMANFGGIAHAAGGDETNIKPGLDLIKQLNALKFWSRGGEVVTQFQSGDVYASIVHAGWCVRARNAGVNVATVHPVIGDKAVGVHKYGWLAIMKSSENVKAANWFLNEYNDADFQLEYARKSGVVPVNALALKALSSDPVSAEMLQLNPADIARQLRVDYSKVDKSVWMDQWNRSVSGQ